MNIEFVFGILLMYLCSVIIGLVCIPLYDKTCMYAKDNIFWVLQHKPVIVALRRLKQEVWEFEDSLDFVVKSCLRNQASSIWLEDLEFETSPCYIWWVPGHLGLSQETLCQKLAKKLEREMVKVCSALYQIALISLTFSLGMYTHVHSHSLSHSLTHSLLYTQHTCTLRHYKNLKKQKLRLAD